MNEGAISFSQAWEETGRQERDRLTAAWMLAIAGRLPAAGPDVRQAVFLKAWALVRTEPVYGPGARTLDRAMRPKLAVAILERSPPAFSDPLVPSADFKADKDEAERWMQEDWLVDSGGETSPEEVARRRRRNAERIGRLANGWPPFHEAVVKLIGRRRAEIKEKFLPLIGILAEDPINRITVKSQGYGSAYAKLREKVRSLDDDPLGRESLQYGEREARPNWKIVCPLIGIEADPLRSLIWRFNDGFRSIPLRFSEILVRLRAVAETENTATCADTDISETNHDEN